MNRYPIYALAVVLLLVGTAMVAALPLSPASASPLSVATSSPVTGTVAGPNLLAQNGVGTYWVNGTGGPAIAANGTKVGNLTYYASVQGVNTTGITFAPDESGIVNGSGPAATLSVNNVTQVLTLVVMISSVLHNESLNTTANESINLTYSVHVVQPYIIAATIINPSTATVLTFEVSIALDGTVVGTAKVPTITPGGSYSLSFKYVTLGLSTGWHTFSISLAAEHGLVSFTNGSLVYSQSIYIPGPPPNYTLWYVLGAVLFLGVLFIFATRVLARRRGVARR